jgi:hypothetical protein
MSALPPKADMDQSARDVRKVPRADFQAVDFVIEYWSRQPTFLPSLSLNCPRL